MAIFVKEHGETLGLPKYPCSPEQEKWEDIAAAMRQKVNNE